MNPLDVPRRPLPEQPVPRPEHPRPDFLREDWLCLNGWWEFAFDPEGLGVVAGWSDGSIPLPERILVPFPWEAPAAWGEAAYADDAHYWSPRVYRDSSGSDPAARRVALRHETGWYRRTFQVPEHWRERRIFLIIGASDFETEVYCNGSLAVTHRGGYDPISADLTPYLDAAHDANVLVVRVYDPMDHGDQPVGKQSGWYERTSGIWQTVYLEARPEVHLARLRITPEVCTHGARIEVGLSPGDGEHLVCVTALSPSAEVFSAEVLCHAGAQAEVRLPLGPDPFLWSPDSPALYQLTIAVSSGDLVSSYFGLREIAQGTLPGTDIPCLTLNGIPFYLRAALHQSFHPAGIYSYVTDRIIRDDLETVRAVGLNALRIHIKIDDPRLYYWADRLGVALLYDLPNPGRLSPLAHQLWEETFRAALERDRNHPSILLWVLFNETWGLGPDYATNADTQAWVASMVDLCHALDPSRPVEDNSACRLDHVQTDINSWHFYLHDPEQARVHIAEVLERTHPGSTWNFVPGRSQQDQPLWNSEYGGIGCRDGDRDVSWSLRWLTAELRRHERITGYVYTELTDVEWEHNGLVRYDRALKLFPYDLRDVFGANTVSLDCLPILHRDPGDRVSVPVLASIFAPLPNHHGTLHWRLVRTDRRGEADVCQQGLRDVCWTNGRVSELAVLEVSLPGAAALCRLDVELRDAAGRRVSGNGVDLITGHLPGLPPIRSSGFSRVQTNREQYWVGEGSGTVTCRLERTGDILCLEAAAGVFGPRQTDADHTPSEIVLRVDGKRLGAFHLPDAPADARGVLSYASGIPGAYGYLLRLLLPSTAAHFDLEIAASSGGVALFGAGAGRYPVGLEVV